jgi:hypothetical protein
MDRKEPHRQATKALSSSGHAATHKSVAPNLMTLRHLGHARPTDTNRHDDLELFIVMPEASPLNPKNFAPHRTPRIRDVVNDVIKHVS